MESPNVVFKNFHHPIFFAASLVVSVISLLLAFHSFASSPGHLGFAIFCLLSTGFFSVAGKLLYNCQDGLKVDSTEKSIVKWKCTGRYTIEKKFPLSNLERVRVSRGTRYVYTKNDERKAVTIYLVGLCDHSDEDKELTEYSDYSKARRCAERLAKATEVPMEDTTVSPFVVRNHDQLNESVGARLLRENTETQLTPPPEGRGLEYVETGEGALIYIPRLGILGMAGAFVILALSPLAFFAVAFSKSDTVFLWTFGPLFLAFVWITLNALASRVIVLDEKNLTVRQNSGLRRKLGHIEISELEEVNLSGPGVLCRSDRREILIEFNKPEDATWVKQTLEHLLLEAEKHQGDELD